MDGTFRDDNLGSSSIFAKTLGGQGCLCLSTAFTVMFESSAWYSNVRGTATRPSSGTPTLAAQYK